MNGIHYFHCTDGVDLIVDRRGGEAHAFGDVIARARMVADEIMRAVPAHREWSRWAVHVYDEVGQLEIVPFVGSDRRSPRQMRPRALSSRLTGRPRRRIR